MMSYLYPEDEVTFDKSGFGPLPDMLWSYAEEEANSYFELYFEYPLLSSHERGDYDQVYVNMSDYLIEGNQVTYKPSHSREPHAFRIYKTEKQVERGIILVWARTRTADLRGNPVRRVVSNDAPVSSALSALKMASEETHPFSFTTNIQSNISFEKYQTNVLDALAGEEDSILAITGGQMIRSNNNIYIGINESSKNVVEFRLGKNIEGISYEVDYSNVVTAVIPFYTQTYKLVDDIRDEIVRDNAGGIVKNPDGSTKYVRTVGKKRESLDDEVIVYGDTVFSQYANDYSTPFYIFYEIRDDREDPGVDKDPLPPFTKADINNRAVDWFEWEENLGIDEPEVYVTVDIHDISQSSEYSHDVNLAKLETLNVFDKTLVYVPEVGIDMEMEINYIRYDGVAEKNLEVRLGNAITSLRETMISPQQRDFNQKVQKLDHEIAKTSLSSDGKARIYWMATKPVGEFEIGDLWFDVSLDGGIYVWDGYDWVAKITSDFGQLVEDSVNAAISAAEDAKALAISEAENALAQAKADATAKANAVKTEVSNTVNTAINTANDAKQTAIDNYNNAVSEAERLVGEQTKSFDTKFGEVEDSVNAFNESVSDVDKKAGEALEKAGANANLLTTHQNTLNTINNTTLPDINKSLSDMLGKADFQVFKTTYEANDKTIKARLLAVDSGKEGSIAYRLNETEKTASGNTTTISNIKTKPGEHITGYQTIKERSDLYERVIGKDEAGIKSNMARMVMTDSLFKTEVIKNVPSAIGGRNYVLKSNDYYYTSNYKVAEYNLSTIPKGTKIKISLWGALGSTVRTFGIYVNNASGLTSGNSQKFELTKLDGVYGRGRSAGLSKWTAEATLNVDASKILIYGFDDNSTSPKRVEYVQIETGDYYTDWTAAQEDKASMSDITLLADSIDLKVSDSELISRINVQAGGILITSGTNKLNITPETTFIEDATIKSAMIDAIDVNKITGINADFTSMVTKALTANTITSTMINANDAMFEKLFANKFATNKLVAQGAWITDANIASLDAGTIKSGTIDSARIDAEYIVTNGLSTNVIKSEHINATVALVNKIFSKEAYIKALTSKSIFANQIKAIEISASKITTGELDGSKASITNIDAKNITANGTNFVQSAWNDLNAFTQIDASGIQMLGSGTWRRTFLSPTGFRLFNGVNGSNKSGAIGYFKSSQDLDGLSNPLKEDFMWQTQQRHAIGIGVNETHLLTLGYQLPGAGNSDGYNPALTIDPQKNGQVTISTDARVNLGLQVDGNLTLPGGDAFTTYNGLYLNTSYWTVKAKTGVRFFVGDQKKLHIGGNVELGTTLDMAGNTITGQSDYRLKKDIETLNSNDLDKLTGVRMVSYEWIDPERPKGTHVGFIAQELQEVYPEFITENDDGILSINNSELAMAHIHATQELNAKVDNHISNVDNEVARLKAQIASLQDELATLKGDRK